jgi:hypothetical protein
MLLKPGQRSSPSTAILIVSLPCGFGHSDIKKFKVIRDLRSGFAPGQVVRHGCGCLDEPAKNYELRIAAQEMGEALEKIPQHRMNIALNPIPKRVRGE